MGIKETLGRVVRIKTEPHDLVLARHLLQMDRIDTETIAALKKLGRSPTAEAMGELHEVMSERIEAMVGGLKGQREVVIFNRYSVPLQPVIYP